jgi:hypothetical protein
MVVMRFKSLLGCAALESGKARLANHEEMHNEIDMSKLSELLMEWRCATCGSTRSASFRTI